MINVNIILSFLTGQVTIDFQVDKETNFIVFHSKNLTLTEKVCTVKATTFSFASVMFPRTNFFFLVLF